MERLKGKYVWDRIIPLSRFTKGQRIRYLHSPKRDELFGIIKKIEWRPNKNVVREHYTVDLDDKGPYYFVEWHKDKERKPWCLWYSEKLLKGYYE